MFPFRNDLHHLIRVIYDVWAIDSRRFHWRHRITRTTYESMKFSLASTKIEADEVILTFHTHWANHKEHVPLKRHNISIEKRTEIVKSRKWNESITSVDEKSFVVKIHWNRLECFSSKKNDTKMFFLENIHVLNQLRINKANNLSRRNENYQWHFVCSNKAFFWLCKQCEIISVVVTQNQTFTFSLLLSSVSIAFWFVHLFVGLLNEYHRSRSDDIIFSLFLNWVMFRHQLMAFSQSLCDQNTFIFLHFVKNKTTFCVIFWRDIVCTTTKQGLFIYWTTIYYSLKIQKEMDFERWK